MASKNASKDSNSVSSLIMVLNSDGKTIVRLAVNPVTHALYINDGTTGTNYGPANALKDENGVSSFMGVSSADLKTPVVIYGDASGNILINSQ